MTWGWGEGDGARETDKRVTLIHIHWHLPPSSRQRGWEAEERDPHSAHHQTLAVQPRTRWGRVAHHPTVPGYGQRNVRRGWAACHRRLVQSAAWASTASQEMAQYDAHRYAWCKWGGGNSAQELTVHCSHCYTGNANARRPCHRAAPVSPAGLCACAGRRTGGGWVTGAAAVRASRVTCHVVTWTLVLQQLLYWRLRSGIRPCGFHYVACQASSRVQRTRGRAARSTAS